MKDREVTYTDGFASGLAQGRMQVYADIVSAGEPIDHCSITGNQYCIWCEKVCLKDAPMVHEPDCLWPRAVERSR